MNAGNERSPLLNPQVTEEAEDVKRTLHRDDTYASRFAGERSKITKVGSGERGATTATFFFFESMHHPSLLPEKAANASGWHALFTADPIFTFLALSMRRGTSCRLQ